MTLELLISQIAKGLPVAVGMFLLLLAGQKRMWVWSRELDAANAYWQQRYDESQKSWAARLQDSHDTCTEWKNVAKRVLDATEKIAPVVVSSVETNK
jgi:hypothetical protein